MDGQAKIGDFQAAFEAGERSTPVGLLEGEWHSPLLVRHKDFTAEDAEKFLHSPSRKRTNHQFNDVGSFTRYLNSQDTPTEKVIFARVHETGAAFNAVLDYHGRAPKAQQWGDHKANFTAVQTVEWKRWMDKNGKPMTQVEFAQFLESNENLFKDPTGAALLELVSTLEGKADVKIGQAVKLQNGMVSINYTEDVELRGSLGEQQGKIEVPGILTLGIAPFEGCALYEVKARLRYRISERRISFSYETINPHLIVKGAVLDIVEQIERDTKIKPFMGSL